MVGEWKPNVKEAVDPLDLARLAVRNGKRTTTVKPLLQRGDPFYRGLL